jgi:hypothetical protein
MPFIDASKESIKMLLPLCFAETAFSGHAYIYTYTHFVAENDINNLLM